MTAADLSNAAERGPQARPAAAGCVLCESPRVELISRLPVSQLVEMWQKAYGVDVADNFTSDSLFEYVCPNCHLEYFQPMVAGNERFYDRIQDFDWYYEKQKWEFGRALDFLKPTDHIVDFGCGDGNFLDHLRSKGYASAYGLDMNPKAVEKGKARGLRVATSFAGLGLSQVDAVVSFQVLEHVTDVRDFLSQMTAVASPGGKVIVAVPNQASFIGTDSNTPNFPPHHLTRWTRESLTAVSRIFPLRVVEIVDEPLSSAHIDWYIATLMHRATQEGLRVWRGMVWGVAAPLLKSILAADAVRRRILGHTIMAVFQKV
jgi:2-polyprenyl-3-methyl-5-hydroxy-6-metoxy-1,4-benzoquinol methylase